MKGNLTSTIVIAIFVALVCLPLVYYSTALVTNKNNYMSDSWLDATQWLKSQLTPMQDATYYKPNTTQEEMGSIPIVLAWWDYGYWIIREAHMNAFCTPGGKGREIAAQMFLETDDNIILERLRREKIKYIVLDNLTAVEKFYGVASLAGKSIGSYYEYQKSPTTKENELIRKPLYYETLLSKLYWDDAKNLSGIREVMLFGLVEIDDKYTAEIKIFEVR